MSFTDPLSGFQRHGIFEIEYLKNDASYILRDKVTIEH